MLREEKLLKALIKNNLTLSIAESCTGGLLSNRLTNISGSSKAFLLGIVAYSNGSKNKLLKIPVKLIQTKGAVSSETAKRMAMNVRSLANTSIAIGITGIAGPDAGAKSKPVGTVFIAISSDKKTVVRKYHLLGRRLEIKRKATDKALDMLLEVIR